MKDDRLYLHHMLERCHRITRFPSFPAAYRALFFCHYSFVACAVQNRAKNRLFHGFLSPVFLSFSTRFAGFCFLCFLFFLGHPASPTKALTPFIVAE